MPVAHFGELRGSGCKPASPEKRNTFLSSEVKGSCLLRLRPNDVENDKIGTVGNEEMGSADRWPFAHDPFVMAA